jgi:ribonuclease T2
MRALALAFAHLALVPGAAAAQAYQCQAPRGVSVPTIARDGPVRDVPVAGYTLALSWSPEYCRGWRGDRADSRQCSGRAGRFGFVVHGLWPEGAGASWPQWCAAAAAPSSAELARNMCMTPSARLLAHAWAKHGTCMESRPEHYFRTVRALWSDLRWPDFDRLSRQEGLTAGQVREAFSQANRAWEPEHIGLALNERGWLEEMRLCYGKDFKPAACPARRWGPADSVAVRIWRGL